MPTIVFGPLTRCLPLIVIASFAVATAAAAGEDQKTYPGALCQPSINTDNFLREQNGRMINNATTGVQTWFCPVEKDETAHYDPLRAQIVVLGGFGTGADGINCDFRSADQIGGDLLVADVDITEPEGAVSRLVFTNLSGLGISDGYYFFRCTVPPRKEGSPGFGVVSYHVLEQWED